VALTAAPGPAPVLAWNGMDDAGRRVPSGVYFARLIHGDDTTVRKLVLTE